MNVPYSLHTDFKRGLCLTFRRAFLDTRLTHIHFIYAQEEIIHDIDSLTQ